MSSDDYIKTAILPKPLETGPTRVTQFNEKEWFTFFEETGLGLTDGTVLCEEEVPFELTAEPLAQGEGIVDALTGPLGVVIATLAVLGVFLSWFFNIIDLRQALWVLVGIAGVAAAPTIVAAVFGG